MNAPAPARPVGRPSKLTPERIERLCAALRAGHARSTAAALAGISESSIYNWLSAASAVDADLEYLQFLADVKAAETEAEDELLAIIRDAAGKSWQAAAWILERRHSDRWAKKFKTDLLSTPPASTQAVAQNVAEAIRLAEETEARCRAASHGAAQAEKSAGSEPF